MGNFMPIYQQLPATPPAALVRRTGSRSASDDPLPPQPHPRIPRRRTRSHLGSCTAHRAGAARQRISAAAAFPLRSSLPPAGGLVGHRSTHPRSCNQLHKRRHRQRRPWTAGQSVGSRRADREPETWLNRRQRKEKPLRWRKLLLRLESNDLYREKDVVE